MKQESSLISRDDAVISKLNYKLSSIELSILAPIAFFSMWGVPARINELSRLSYFSSVSKDEVGLMLSNLQSKGIISFVKKYVWLLNGQYRSADRTVPSAQIVERNRSILTYIASIPWVRSVIITNSLALETAHENSDIDLMVIVSAGKIAIVRDWVNIVLGFLGKRPNGKSKRGKIAIDVWLDESYLDIKDFRLPKKDVYFDFWFAHLKPVYDREETFHAFLAQNSWIQKVFPNYQPLDPPIYLRPSVGAMLVKSLIERVFNNAIDQWVVDKLSRWQLLRLARRAQTVDHSSGTILISPSRLRFNVPDKRAEYQEQFDKVIQGILLKSNP